MLRLRIALLLTALTTIAHAGTPLGVGSSAGAESTPIFVAAEEGIFARHGLDVKVTRVPLMPNLPAAVLSNSIQIGFMNATTFLQAVGGGLDLMAVSGGSVTSHKTTNVALMAGESSGIHSAQDLIGRKVGVPGLGAVLHVTLCYWLGEQGVDFHKVQFIETTFASMRDQLKGGTVAAVAAMDPYAKTIRESDAGYTVADYLQQIPEGKPNALFVSTRAWALANPDTVKAFRASMADAVAFTADHQDQARLDFGKYVNLPQAALLATDTGVHQPHLTADQLDWWIGVMRNQGLLTEQLDAANLIAP